MISGLVSLRNLNLFLDIKNYASDAKMRQACIQKGRHLNEEERNNDKMICGHLKDDED